MTRVAWIGLGAMGSRMALRLAGVADVELRVWNRTRERTEPLAVAGAHVAASLADAVREAEAIFVMVADPAALCEVTEGGDGILDGMTAGATVIEMSTVGPAAIARLASRLPDGSSLVDAPVLGSTAEAAAGQLTLLTGGAAPTIERLRPLLATFGRLVYLGPTGSGAAAKLVAQAALLGSVAMLGETLAIAGALGLSPDAGWRVLAHTPLAAQAERRRPSIDADSYPPRFALSLATKDAELIAQAITGATAPLTEGFRRWFAAARAAGLGDLDYTSVLRHILSVSGDDIDGNGGGIAG